MGIDSETKQKVAIKKMAITKKNKVHLETELVREKSIWDLFVVKVFSGKAMHKASSDHPNVVPMIEAFMMQVGFLFAQEIFSF